MSIYQITDNLSVPAINAISGAVILTNLIIDPQILFLVVTGAAIVSLNIFKIIGQIRINKKLDLENNELEKRLKEREVTVSGRATRVTKEFGVEFSIILITTAVVGSQTGFNVAEIIPVWLTTILGAFGGMMAALGMGILLSFLMKKPVHFAIFIIGFMMIKYLGLSMMAVAIFAIAAAVIYYYVVSAKAEKEQEGGVA